MKHIIYLRNYILITTLTFICFGCGKKDNPDPSNSNSNNNPSTTQPLVIDNSFSSISGSCFAAALQPDGKLVIAGGFGSAGNYPYKVYRLNQNGGIDNSFNIDVDKTWVINNFSAMAILNDGKIMLGGDFTINGTRKILVRLTATGALDNGFTSPNFNKISNILPTIRKIIVVGSDRVLIEGQFNTLITAGTDYNHLIKITYNGLLDPSFRLNVLTTSFLNDLLPLSDGKFYVTGTFYWGSGVTARQYIAKLNTDGSVDASFNFKETLTGRLGPAIGSINTVALQSDGKIVIGGDFIGIVNSAIRDGAYNYIQVARLNTDGSIDFNFSTSEFYNSAINSIAILPDNRILAGRGFNLNGSGDGYARLYSNNGVIDKTFNLGFPNSGVTQVIKQSDDKYILTGSFTDPAGRAVIRITK
ncbi:putative delta-60 repeat protein [Mucilaginibacter gracilis]|uniref:Putative delta-60 repeat protein n=1 Tax=Mucilaginibacter gracilis TaxID=423350 RepID=A0A495JA16_9SPHI|nr:delta-60 repeat domain-containing protein [Mucilaginibacter gracilis]RKR85765.1 putative delta-60 repeat protein [Mucilaginibacter gracilis]